MWGCCLRALLTLYFYTFIVPFYMIPMEGADVVLGLESYIG